MIPIGPWCPLNEGTASDVLYELQRDYDAMFDPLGFPEEEIIEREER